MSRVQWGIQRECSEGVSGFCLFTIHVLNVRKFFSQFMLLIYCIMSNFRCGKNAIRHCYRAEIGMNNLFFVSQARLNIPGVRFSYLWLSDTATMLKLA